MSDRTDEVIALNETINWWRGRYNNIISTMSCAVNGEVVHVDDSSTEYPLSDGAKTLLARLARQSAENKRLWGIIAVVETNLVNLQERFDDHLNAGSPYTVKNDV